MARHTNIDSSIDHTWDDDGRDDGRDDLDELIAERTKNNPEFPKLIEAAAQRRQAARARGEDPNDFPQAEEE